MILDEATSNLDSISEVKIQVGSRLAIGTHETLLRTNPMYGRVWSTQQMGSSLLERTC